MGKLSQEIVMKKVKDLTEHPENWQVFGDPSPEHEKILEQSIKEKGITDPIIISPSGKILSGHRRLRVAQKLGMNEVPCRIFYSDFPEEEDEIWLEANLSQRHLSPYAAFKAFQVYEERRKKDFENLKGKLIPVLADALEKGNLNTALARAIAKIPFSEQEKFISLIGTRIKGANQIKINKLQKILKNKEKEIESIKKLSDEQKQLIKSLENQLELLQAEKEKIRKTEKDKEDLLKQLALLEEKIQTIPSVQKDEIEKLQNEINCLKKEIKEKEKKISYYKEKLSLIDELKVQLEAVKKEKEEIKKKLKEDLQKEIEKIKKQQPKKEIVIAKPQKGYEVVLLIDRLIEFLSEIWVEAEKYSPEIKEALLQKVNDLYQTSKMARKALLGAESIKEKWQEI